MNSIFILGKAVSGLPILGHRLGEGCKTVLILGGVHGDEVEGVTAATALVEKLIKKPIQDLGVYIVPTFNVDGVLAKTRVNKRGVDLNRNLPTQDWNPKAFNERYPPGPHANSEPENQALVKFIDETKLDLIVSLHSFHRYLLNINGDCRQFAEWLHEKTGYPIEPTMGYPTPGCLGTYTGIEKGVPTLTYEIERGLSDDKIVSVHVEALHDALRRFA